MKMQDLTGKVAVLTGASSGIAKAAARLLASEGVRVVLAARRREATRGWLPNWATARDDPDQSHRSARLHPRRPSSAARPAGAMITSVSSTGGRYGVEGWSMYCTTKYALVGFHETLRKEVGADGIGVTVIEPGAAWTEFDHNVAPADLHTRRERLDALASDDVAQALLHAFAQHPPVLVQEILVRPVKHVVP